MSNTTTTYLSIESHLARYQQMTAAEPAVKTAGAYYKTNIGKVATVDQFVGNYRLLSYALQAYGLGDQIGSTALIKKVLEGGVSNPKALANTLSNPAWRAFAAAFNFSASGSASPSSSASVTTTTDDYVEQQLESEQGQSDPGVQLALYFHRVAPTTSNAYGILGDQNLLETVQTIFGLAPTSNASQIDAEAAAVGKLVPNANLRDPAKLEQLVERFTANYDAKYGPSSGSSGSLAVASGNQSTSSTAASTVLSDIVSSNASALSSDTGGALINPMILSSLRLGG